MHIEFLYGIKVFFMQHKTFLINATYQVRSQNLKEVPQNFMEVFNADDATVNDVIRKNQHRQKKLN